MSDSACIPMPMQIVIDDVGWWQGQDGHLKNQPYRTGIERPHVIKDYRAIVRLGQKLGMAPQCSMILSEWDTKNRLRTIPTASWMGDQWENPVRRYEEMEEAAQIIRDHPKAFEFGMHGLGHEYWENGTATRAEYHDCAKKMRPVQEIKARFDLFLELAEQHNFGHRPRSLVPPAGLHCFRHSETNLASIARSYGFTGIYTPFEVLSDPHEPGFEWFGFDHDIITVNRWFDLYTWKVVAPEPSKLPYGPICAMHWPHILHSDPERNFEVVDRWVTLLQPLANSFDRVLSRNNEAFLSQLVHHAVTTLRHQGNRIEIDATAFFDLPWGTRPASPSVLVKIRSGPDSIICREVGLSSTTPVIIIDANE